VIWFLAVALADTPPDYVQTLASGVGINWTRMALTVERSAQASGTQSKREAVEQLARRAIHSEVERYCGEVQVTADQTVADLQTDPAFAEPLASRLERWVVAEARYFSSGRVELVAELPLQEFLKPWTAARAQEALEGRQPQYSGLVVDARGSGASATFAPRLLAQDGEELFRSVLWHDEALTSSPVIYVTDPAHPAATRAGDNPMFLRAKDHQGADLVLDVTEAGRYRTALAEAALVGKGTVTIVLDAP
jgi:hypothetical protein